MKKIIHYCWFGGGELSDTAKKSIASWTKYAPDFEIRRCDESNFDVNCCDFSRDAYASKRWAFVSDYARFKLIYDYGGIYMDVGSELIKNLDSLINCIPFSAIEDHSLTVSSGLILAGDKQDEIIAKVLAKYESISYEDTDTFRVTHIVNHMFTDVLIEFGFEKANKKQCVAGWTLYPSQYFNPVFGFGGFHIGSDTYSIHHYSGSWLSPKEKTKKDIAQKVTPFLGRFIAAIVGRFCTEIKHEGFVKGLCGFIRRSTKTLVSKTSGLMRN